MNVLESTSHRNDDDDAEVLPYCAWCGNDCPEGEALCDNCEWDAAEERRRRGWKGGENH